MCLGDRKHPGKVYFVYLLREQINQREIEKKRFFAAGSELYVIAYSSAPLCHDDENKYTT